MDDLAKASGLGGFRYVIDLGVAASFFAVTIASINAASRVLYTMGEEDVLPRVPAARAHQAPDAARGDRRVAPIMGWCRSSCCWPA